jgi:hypothetical protein
MQMLGGAGAGVRVLVVQVTTLLLMLLDPSSLLYPGAAAQG